MARSFVCASPYHRGDRFIASLLDAFERRIEFRRMSDQGRETVLLDRIVCRACLQAEARDRRGGSRPPTARLFDRPREEEG